MALGGLGWLPSQRPGCAGRLPAQPTPLPDCPSRCPLRSWLGARRLLGERRPGFAVETNIYKQGPPSAWQAQSLTC